MVAIEVRILPDEKEEAEPFCMQFERGRQSRAGRERERERERD